MDFDTFLDACKDGDLTTVGLGLRDVNLQHTDKHGNTPLMWAAYYGRIEVVPSLIPGSDLNQGDKEKRTALMWAIMMGRHDVVQLLISGSDLAQTDRLGCTSLLLAAAHGKVDVVKTLIPVSELHHVDEKGQTALDWALYKQHWHVAELLVEHDPDPDALAWPPGVKPEALPRWHARIEQKLLTAVSPDFTDSTRSPEFMRARL